MESMLADRLLQKTYWSPAPNTAGPSTLIPAAVRVQQESL